MNVSTLDPKKLEGASSADLAQIGLVLARVNEPTTRENLARATHNALPGSVLKDHFAYSATLDGQLAGGVWAGVGSFPEIDLGFSLELATNQAWIYCAFVEKEMRGKRIYGNVLSFAVKHLIENGFEEILVAVNPWNKPSVKVHSRFVDRRVGRIYAMRLFSIAIVFRTGDLRKDRTLTMRARSNPIKLTTP